MANLNLKTTNMKPMNKPAEKYKSEFLSDLLSEIDPKEQAKTDKRMMLAAQIDKARLAKNWSKKELANRMGKRPSEITKWLSGTHNFTTDTLFDLEYLLDAKFINLDERPKEQVLHFHLNISNVVKANKAQETARVNEPLSTYSSWASLNQFSC